MQPLVENHTTAEPPWKVDSGRGLCRLFVDGELYRVQQILQISPASINVRHPLGWAPLHVAVLCGDLAFLKLITAVPGLDIGIKDESSFDNNTSEADIIQRREELCPRISVLEKTTGATALHFACMRGDQDILSLVLGMYHEGAHDVRDASNRLPPDYFDIRSVSLETLKLYHSTATTWRRRWQSLVEKSVKELCDAIREGDYEYCKEIIETQPNLAVESYRSLFQSVKAAIQSLKPTNARLDGIIEDDYHSSSTALHYACLLGNLKIAELLLRNGASWTKADSSSKSAGDYMSVNTDDEAREFKRLCEEEDTRRKEKLAEAELMQKEKLAEEERVKETIRMLEVNELIWAGAYAEQLEIDRENDPPRPGPTKKDAETRCAAKERKDDKRHVRKKKTDERKAERKKQHEENTIRKRLLEIEKTVSHKMIGQRGPIRSIASAIRLRENGWVDPDRPLVMLFLGSSGIGKTELAKRIAHYLHRGKDNGKKKTQQLTEIENAGTFVRVDMSEYQHSHTVSNLTGSPKGYVGYEEGGVLTKKLKKNPEAIVLLDEIEKAHPDVLTVFLQLFDDGRITDPKLGTIHCPKAIFIMTSNLGAEEIKIAAPALQALVKETEDSHEQYLKGIGAFNKKLYPLLKKSLKRDEFIGRINQIVVFLPFNDEEITRIVETELRKWKERAGKHHSIQLTWSSEVVQRLVQGYDVNYGARSVTNEVKSCAVQLVAEAQIRGDIKKSWNAHLVINEAGDIGLVASEGSTGLGGAAASQSLSE